MSIAIPDSHRDLLEGPVNTVLSTVMPDGRPQTTPIWCNLDGYQVLINTMQGFRKEKNMRGNPLVTLLAYKLKEPLRNIEVRGRVIEMSEEGALEHLVVERVILELAVEVCLVPGEIHQSVS